MSLTSGSCLTDLHSIPKRQGSRQYEKASELYTRSCFQPEASLVSIISFFFQNQMSFQISKTDHTWTRESISPK